MNSHYSSESIQGRLHRSPWFHIPRPLANPRMRLFCFTYAGGSAWVFNSWPRELPADVEVVCVQLPGRGARIREQAMGSVSAIVDCLERELTGNLDVPFAFFGHSMGGKIAFELARRLNVSNKSVPFHLLVSGCPAPTTSVKRVPIHNLPADEFWDELRKLNGTPDEVFQNPELMELMEPLLRADFKAIETWVYESNAPLNIPLTAFTGQDDALVSLEHLCEWSKETTGEFSYRVFSGDHFFINQDRENLLTCICDILGYAAKPLTEKQCSAV